MPEELLKYKDKALAILNDSILQFNGFPSLEICPNAGLIDWTYTYPSPFIQSNVLYSLLKSNSILIAENYQILFEGLVKHVKFGKVVRFWPLDECLHPVPFDFDDTAMVSHVLEKLGYKLQNKQLIKKFISQKGKINTWLFPSIKMISSPFILIDFIINRNKFKPTINANMLSKDDYELGVIANVIMYLGENEMTKPCINFIIDTWKSNSDPKHFYDNQIIIDFFIARAYDSGVLGLRKISDLMHEKICNLSEQHSCTELLLLYLTCRYFHFKELQIKFKSEILNRLTNNQFEFETFPFFTSKNREFYGGSYCLSAAWFLEATKEW